MSDPITISSNELLARFVIRSSWFRQDNTVRPEAFMPRPVPHLDLSTTRRNGIELHELWEIGRAIAANRLDSEKRAATLYGRADVFAGIFSKNNLAMTIDLFPKNHVNIIGWPADKSSLMRIAKEIAASAVFVPIPKEYESQ